MNIFKFNSLHALYFFCHLLVFCSIGPTLGETIYKALQQMTKVPANKKRVNCDCFLSDMVPPLW